MSLSKVVVETPNQTAGYASFADEFLAHVERCSEDPRMAASDCIRVLDVGAGNARIPIKVCSQRDVIRLIAIDRSPRALETAKRNVEQAGLLHSIRVILANAQLLPFANATFDAVISNSLLHHVANRLAVLTEFMRVLRPGGLLFIRDTLKGPDAGRIAEVLSNSCQTPGIRRAVFERALPAMLTIHEARDLAAAAGISRDCVRHSGPRHWLLVFRQQKISELGFRIC